MAAAVQFKAWLRFQFSAMWGQIHQLAWPHALRLDSLTAIVAASVLLSPSGRLHVAFDSPAEAFLLKRWLTLARLATSFAEAFQI